jgi:histone acetyltransferase (RNA polymerase elongator complex component)
VAPPQRTAHDPETISLLVDSYKSRWPDAALHVGFFHGGVPSAAQLKACGGLPVRLSTHPADLNQATAAAVRDAGGAVVELEAMSLDPHVLRTCKRAYTPSRVRSMATRLTKMGFKVGLHLVPGLPGSDVAGAIADVEALIDDGGPWVDFVRIWPALGFEGADLARWAQAGRWRPWDVAQTVDVVGAMVAALDNAGVPIARIGIQPGQDIPVQAVAGPVHPNLRGEIESRRFGDRIRSALCSHLTGTDVVIAVHAKDLSWAKGTSNVNGRTAKAHFGLKSLEFVADASLERGTVRVIGGKGEP